MQVVCRRMCVCRYQAHLGRKVKENSVFLLFFDIYLWLLLHFVHVRTMYMRACMMSIAVRIKESTIRHVDGKPTESDQQHNELLYRLNNTI